MGEQEIGTKSNAELLGWSSGDELLGVQGAWHSEEFTRTLFLKLDVDKHTGTHCEIVCAVYDTPCHHIHKHFMIKMENICCVKRL